jgi:PIN domain nuclease of toxin-antitoxin system
MLLDTHIFLWWIFNAEKIPEAMLSALQTAEASKKKLSISVISLWEVAMLVKHKKISISVNMDSWFDEVESGSYVNVIPLSADIILESARLGENFHKDPVDQLIVGTARTKNLRLATCDRRIIESGVVVTL